MRKPGLATKAMDDEGRSMLYDGCSLSQLGIIFKMDNREISRKIAGLSPSGERLGYPIYNLAEAAARLVPPQGNIEEAIKKMSPKDLPPAITKEYWAGQHARLKFEEDNGDLWRTADIVERLSEAFKTLRMNLLLMRDQVERQTLLTDKQREIIQTLIDGALNELADSLIAKFKNDQARTSHDEGWQEPSASEEDIDL